MKPESYRPLHPRDSCSICKYACEVRGTFLLICAKGEDVTGESAYQTCTNADDFKECFDRWVAGRSVEPDAVCDEFEELSDM